MSRAYRWVLAWGLRRALRPARGASRWSFLGGVSVGAGLMYLLANRAEPSSRAPAGRSPRRKPRAPARTKAAAR